MPPPTPALALAVGELHPVDVALAPGAVADDPVEGERLTRRDHQAVHPRRGEPEVRHLVVLEVHLVEVELAQQQRAVLLEPDREVVVLVPRRPHDPTRPRVPHPLRTPPRAVRGHRRGQQPGVALRQPRGSGETRRQLSGSTCVVLMPGETSSAAIWLPEWICRLPPDPVGWTHADAHRPLPPARAARGRRSARAARPDRRPHPPAVRDRGGRDPRARHHAVLLSLVDGARGPAVAQHRGVPLGQALDLHPGRLLPRPGGRAGRARHRRAGRGGEALPGDPDGGDGLVAGPRVPGPRHRHRDAARDLRTASTTSASRRSPPRPSSTTPPRSASHARSASGPRRSTGSCDRASWRSTSPGPSPPRRSSAATCRSRSPAPSRCARSSVSTPESCPVRSPRGRSQAPCAN